MGLSEIHVIHFVTDGVGYLPGHILHLVGGFRGQTAGGVVSGHHQHRHRPGGCAQARGDGLFNVYAQRATNPDTMERVCNSLLHRENLEAFRYVLSLSEEPAVWAAWGAVIEKRAYLPECVRDFLSVGKEYGARWYCAGPISKKGHPHHPLYLRKDEKLKPFDVESYLDTLEKR